jgi:hypothetical protein
MTYKETQREQNQTLSMVPLNEWQDFKIECAKQRITMTEGFLRAKKAWKKAIKDKAKNSD